MYNFFKNFTKSSMEWKVDRKDERCMCVWGGGGGMEKAARDYNGQSFV